MKVFLKHSLRYKWAAFLVFLGVFIGIFADTLTPIFYKQILDSLAQQNSRDISGVINPIWWIVILNIISWFGYRLATYVNNFFQPRVMADLLNTCYRYLQNHSFSFFSDSFTGSLVKKVTRYSRAYEDITDQFFWFVGPVILRVAIILVVLCFRQWVLAAVMLVWSLVYVAFNYGYARFKIKYDIRAADADTKATAHLADAITNNINIKLFNGQDREYTNHKSLTEKLFRLRKLSWDLSSHAESIQAGLMVVLELAIILLGVHYWQKGILTVGDFALLQAYMMQIFGRLWDLGRYIRRIYQNLADAEEMTDILEIPHGIQDIPGAVRLNVSQGGINYSGLTFAYGRNKPVLKNFNLSITPGERVALIGPSGGGKSTIVKLLFRFHDIQG
ncbi:MAG: ABC transporter ATP-binding protein, partial [bacterium]|nr:ABC transporter ATP-binding protein [bacterium]